MDAETYGSLLPKDMSDDRLPLTVDEIILQLEARFDYNPPVNPSVVCDDAGMYGLRQAYCEGQRSVVDYLRRLKFKPE